MYGNEEFEAVTTLLLKNKLSRRIALLESSFGLGCVYQSTLGIFLVFLILWQLLIGDGCILDRTLEDYKHDLSDGDTGDELDEFVKALVCSIDNQLGVYFHIFIISLCLTIGGVKNRV